MEEWCQEEGGCGRPKCFFSLLFLKFYKFKTIFPPIVQAGLELGMTLLGATVTGLLPKPGS